MISIKKVPLNEITHVCMAFTNYTLLQFLLLNDWEKIQHTFFFLEKQDPKVQFFPNSFTLRPLNLGSRNVFRTFFNYITSCLLLVIRDIKWPFLKNAVIFAQDHLLQAWPLLKGRKYILLEDGFGSYHKQSLRISWLRDLAKLPFYPIAYRTWGNAENCTHRILTKHPPADSFLWQKEIIFIDLKSLWIKCPHEKKDFILRVFQVSPKVLDHFRKFENIILTQCFSEDGIISENEKIACYRNIMNHYHISEKKTIIKTHPREKTDYKKYFPEVFVCSQKFPVEIIALATDLSARIYTVASTGVFAFNQKNVIWCGTDYSDALREKYGILKKPF